MNGLAAPSENSSASWCTRSLLTDGLRQVYGLPSGVPADMRPLAHVTTYAARWFHQRTRLQREAEAA